MNGYLLTMTIRTILVSESNKKAGLPSQRRSICWVYKATSPMTRRPLLAPSDNHIQDLVPTAGSISELSCGRGRRIKKFFLQSEVGAILGCKEAHLEESMVTFVLGPSNSGWPQQCLLTLGALVVPTHSVGVSASVCVAILGLVTLILTYENIWLMLGNIPNDSLHQWPLWWGGCESTPITNADSRAPQFY